LNFEFCLSNKTKTKLERESDLLRGQFFTTFTVHVAMRISRLPPRLLRTAGPSSLRRSRSPAVPLLVSASESFRRDGHGHSSSRGSPFTFMVSLAPVLLASVVASTASLTPSESQAASGDEGSAQEALKARLLKQLRPIRERRRSSPSVQLSVDSEGVFRLSFAVAAIDLLPAALNAFAKSLALGPTSSGLLLAPPMGSDAVDTAQGDLNVVLSNGKGSISVGVQGNGTCRLTFYKDEAVSEAELAAFVAAYEAAAFTSDRAPSLTPRPRRAWGGFASPQNPMWNGPQGGSQAPDSSRSDMGTCSAALERLEQLGAVVYRDEAGDGGAPESSQIGSEDKGTLDWSCLAGYDDVRRDVEDTILLGLKHPEEYDTVTRKTRARFESNRPRAILFEGPPGTGKTTTARIVASQAKVPMIYIPIESVMSKYYGESESRLSEMLKLCDELGNAIVFLDEIDSLATSRDSGPGANMHEATRRLLSVLLRTLEGFQERTSSILIAATNRKQDLDSALVSRFDMSILFPLPSEGARRAIFERYAKQLSSDDLNTLAAHAQGFSGRDIKDTCKHAERRWVSQFLRQREAASNKTSELEIPPPPFEVYAEALKVRRQQLQHDNTVQLW